MRDSKIEWTHHTFNPWRIRRSPSCGRADCYAETLSRRNPGTLGVWGASGTRVVAAESAWREPLKWDRAGAKAGERHRVFCASLADVFEGPETMPAESWTAVTLARRRLGDLILNTPNLDWLLLTKRPQNVAAIAADMWVRPADPTLPLPRNVWLGTSVENQEAAGVPFHFKQWGAWLPQPLKDWREGDRVWMGPGDAEPPGCNMWRHGALAKQYEPAIYRALDGREHSEFPR